MRLLILATLPLVIVTSGAAPVGAQQQSITGRYSVTFEKAAPASRGPWTLLLNADSSFTVVLASDTVVQGRYRAAPGKITFTDVSGRDACPSDKGGVYSWTLVGDALSLRVVSDACDPRRQTLAAKPFHRSS